MLYSTPRLSVFFALIACSTAAPPDATQDTWTGDPVFLTGADQEGQLARQLADAHLDRLAPQLGVPLADLVADRVTVDRIGLAHVRYQQFVDDVPVLDGQIVAHLHPDGTLQVITGALVPDLAIDTTPLYSAEEAMDLAADATVGWGALTEDPTADLWVLRHNGTDHLVWRVQLYRLDGTADTSMPLVYIDAHTGAVVHAYNNLKTGAATGSGSGYYSGSVSLNTYLSGSTYTLEDSVRDLGTYTWKNTTTTLSYLTDTDNAWTASSQKIGVQAHHNAAQVWDYYSSTHGRSGLDDAGGPGYIGSVTGTGSVITSTVSYGSGYANAFWDGSEMVYGDGDGSTFGPLVSLDISGHEMTHAITEDEVGFTYESESGGIDESYADVFGAMVERYADGATSSDTWRIGEDTYTPGTSGDALRYVSSPASDGDSYDYYACSAYGADVHYNSGIPNLAFYLTAMGGSHPTRGGTSLTGIGEDAAAEIWYYALTSGYLSAGSSFSTLRSATLSAASSLYGSSSAEYSAVKAAWTAVGVPTTCSSSTGSLSSSGSSTYKTSSSGFTTSASGTISVGLKGPSTADFDLYLQKKSGSSWSTVATSAGDTSTEAIDYTASAGTYRFKVTSYSGTGSFTLKYSKP